LTHQELDEVQSLIDVGEYGVALETMADIYAEENKNPSARVVALIEGLALAMSMQPHEVLRRLRK
jgi:dihydroxyacetone kinase DhaKLM complex PTS-EIIA-like component DhaM